jgi:hypothetical protein
MATSGPKLDPPWRFQLPAAPSSKIAAGSGSVPTDCAKALPEQRNNEETNTDHVQLMGAIISRLLFESPGKTTITGYTFLQAGSLEKAVNRIGGIRTSGRHARSYRFWSAFRCPLDN